MKAAVIIQARMSSSRLPGKVMLTANDKPLLGYLLERLSQSKKKPPIIVATSKDSSDDVIAEYCLKKNVECFRGELNNVAKRFMDCVIFFDLAAFVRVSADSPLLDWRIIDDALDVFDSKKYSIVTNTYLRTYPRGQSVEVVDGPYYVEHYQQMNQPEDFEHVTHFFYRSAGEHNIYSLHAERDYSAFNFCVDTPKDYQFFLDLLNRTSLDHARSDWRALVALHEDLRMEMLNREDTRARH